MKFVESCTNLGRSPLLSYPTRCPSVTQHVNGTCLRPPSSVCARLHPCVTHHPKRATPTQTRRCSVVVCGVYLSRFLKAYGSYRGEWLREACRVQGDGERRPALYGSPMSMSQTDSIEIRVFRLGCDLMRSKSRKAWRR